MFCEERVAVETEGCGGLRPFLLECYLLHRSEDYVKYASEKEFFLGFFGKMLWIACFTGN